MDAVEGAVEAFRRESGIRVRTSFGPTSTLARQLVAGAPAQLFLSASREWADHVAEARVVWAHRVVAGNRIVVVRQAPGDDPGGRARLAEPLRIGPGDGDRMADLLLGDDGRRIALADPAAVPAGIYARQALERLGLWDRLRPRTLPTLDVRAALAMVERGEAGAAMVYASDAAVARRAVLAARLDPALHDPIRYPALLLADDGAARRLLRYLVSPAAAEQFRRRGFSAPPGSRSDAAPPRADGVAGRIR